MLFLSMIDFASYNDSAMLMVLTLVVIMFEMFNDKWREMIANSKFKDMKGFGTGKKGRICLQDHDDPVWYRNIKIKEFD